jgi:hypothetical protein
MTHFAKRHYEAIALAMQEAKPECMVHLCFHMWWMQMHHVVYVVDGYQ